MHRAPAVSYPAGKSRWHLRAIVLLWSLGCLACFLILQSQVRIEWMVLTFACVSVAGMLSLVAWRNTVLGILRWDGERWQWSGFVDAGQCEVDVVVDLQKVMLIRVRNASAQRTWLWLSFEAATIQWMPLRRALVSGLRLRDNPRRHPDKESLLEL